MIWTLILGAALAAQAPAPSSTDTFGPQPVQTERVGAAAFSTLAEDLATPVSAAAPSMPVSRPASRQGIPLQPLLLGLGAMIGVPSVLAWALVAGPYFIGFVVGALAYSFLAAPALAIIGCASILRKAQRAGEAPPLLAKLGLGLSVAALGASAIGWTMLVTGLGDEFVGGVGVVVGGTLPVVSGGLLVAFALKEWGGPGWIQGMSVGVGPVPGGAGPAIALRF